MNPPSVSPAWSAFRAGHLLECRIGGTIVRVHWSVALVGVVISALTGFDANEAAACGFGFLILIALHELGHVVAARLLGMPVSSVIIAGIGGHVGTRWPSSARGALLLYSSGLLAQAALLLATLAWVRIAGPPASVWGQCLLLIFVPVNAVIFIINAIPTASPGNFATDGYALWKMTTSGLFGRAAEDFHARPMDAAPVLTREVALTDQRGMAPWRFRRGIAIYNDRTTPMGFVVDVLQRHLGLPEEIAVRWMLRIHNRGGTLFSIRDISKARRIAEAIRADATAQGFPLRCEVVG